MRVLKIVLLAFLTGWCVYIAGFHSWLASGGRVANPAVSERWSIVFIIGAGAFAVWMVWLIVAGFKRGEPDQSSSLPTNRGD